MKKFRLSSEGVTILIEENEAVIKVDQTTFVITQEEISQHLADKWLDDESVFINIDTTILELFNNDYKSLYNLIEDSKIEKILSSSFYE